MYSLVCSGQSDRLEEVKRFSEDEFAVPLRLLSLNFSIQFSFLRRIASPYEAEITLEEINKLLSTMAFVHLISIESSTQ